MVEERRVCSWLVGNWIDCPFLWPVNPVNIITPKPGLCTHIFKGLVCEIQILEKKVPVCRDHSQKVLFGFRLREWIPALASVGDLKCKMLLNIT